MPLLLCPNDDGPMQTVQRSGVEFVICPTYRDAWLDRGKLEKMLATARQDMAGGPPTDPHRRSSPISSSGLSYVRRRGAIGKIATTITTARKSARASWISSIEPTAAAATLQSNS
ncbi:MAG: zf-TFIIB domain-containing protein [Hyphomicrobium aestuarii]|nr:zf-TFIIB domain-containing protein [Hyphomicrobium aestuarii]